jgi:two-component system, response regulator PdtaR
VVAVPACERTHFGVLVVDDEPLIRAGIALHLRELGLRVIEACSADEALSLLDVMRGEIDLVVSDVRMPGAHDGFDLANLLSSIEPPIPVILMTAFAGDRKTPPGMLVLYKPFLVEELASIVFVTLGLPPLRASSG